MNNNMCCGRDILLEVPWRGVIVVRGVIVARVFGLYRVNSVNTTIWRIHILGRTGMTSHEHYRMTPYPVSES